jgi:hypothetical protein
MAVAQEGGAAEIMVTVHYLDDFEQPQIVTSTLRVEVEEPEQVDLEAEPSQEEEGGFWDKVLQILRGLVGLGS